MVIVEKSFPRGGVVKPSKTENKTENIIFGATQRKKKSGPKHNVDKTPDELQDEQGEQQIKVLSTLPVSYQSVQDGMVIMGVVKFVDQISVKIALPGRMSVKVQALGISNSYTKTVGDFVRNPSGVENYKPLTEMFHVGKIVYGKVTDKKAGENGYAEIDFSLKPSDVHSDLVHSNIKKGFVFNGAVEEVQEHGYIIETGIKGLRCFLPIEKSQPGHAVGELVFMKVEELKQQSSTSIIRCKEVKQNQLKIKDQIDPNLDYLLPGAIVSFTVTKHLKDGLQGTIMNGTFNGLVNEHYLQEVLASIEDVELNSTVNARILYVAPLTKFVFLSLNLFDSDEQAGVFQRGEIVEKAAAHHIGSGGVVMVLKNQYKGVISLRALKAKLTGNYDMDYVLAKYTRKSKHSVRILDYDPVGRFYICTDDPVTVGEKVFTVADISPGDIVTATVLGKDKKIKGYSLQIGKAHAAIEGIFLASTSVGLAEKSKLKCRIVALNPERNLAYVTNLPEYMSKNPKILTSIEKAKVNATFLGTIVKCDERLILVKFFNNIKGVLYRSKVSEISNFYEGQTMPFRIMSKSEDNLVLGLPEETFEIGELCLGRVAHVLESGLEILVESKQEDCYSLRAIIPDRLLSEFSDLLGAKLSTYTIDQEIRACCIAKNVFSIRDVPYFEEGTVEWRHVKEGDIFRSFIKNVEGDVIEIQIPIKGFKKPVKLHRKMLVMNTVNPINIVLAPDQVVYVKILTKQTNTKIISVSGKLTDVWEGNLVKTGEYFEKYLMEVRGIKKTLKKLAKPIGKLSVGAKVTASYQDISEETGDWIVQIEDHNVTGLIKKFIVGKKKPPAKDATIECVVIWIDYQYEVVYLSNVPGDITRITTDKGIPPNLINRTGINGKVMLKTDSALICSLKKGTNPLIYVPTRLYYNDFEAGSTSKVKEGDFCKLCFIHEQLPIAVLEETYKLWHEVQKTKRKLEERIKNVPPHKKAKITPYSPKPVEEKKVEDVPMFYEDRVPSAVESESESEAAPPKRKRTLEQLKSPLQKKRTSEKTPSSATKVQSLLPGATNFWSTDLSSIATEKNADSSSDDDEEETPDDSTAKKKKKLTASEKYKAAREEETRLREIEEKYANPDILPETTDQFDRLVLSEPNNSKNWINYMVFHLQAMEIDKARAVARRALKSISFRESDELMNIWVGLLNLELRYGTKESFDEVLKESLLSNDQFKIYMRVLEILTEANKTSELVELIGVVTKKFKEKMEMWKCCAIAFYKAGIHDRAQQMMHKALAVLPEREHVNTIVAFANLTHKYSKTPETAHTLLDQVVTSYPKRVDVWSQLIDMLIKDNQIVSARRTLERAIVQKIPLKKMRTIFKKFLEFEERYGTPNDVERVKVLAAEYVKNNVS